MDTGCQSVLSLSIDELSSREDVCSADVSASARKHNEAVYTGGGQMAIEMSAVVRSSMGDSGGETHVPLMATQSEGSEADQDVCACCGTSLDENDYSTGHPGEHFHGSQLEVPHVGMAHNFVEEFAAEEVSDGAEITGSCLMPGQLMQHNYWYPYACPPNPYVLPPSRRLHSMGRYARLLDFLSARVKKRLVIFSNPVHVYLNCGAGQ